MPAKNLNWAIPVMRVGYSGRALVYLVVAGFALWALWKGNRPSATSSVFASLETSLWGSAILLAIFAGMLAFALWRFVDALYDLEDNGHDAKGVVARLAQFVTGALHLAIGLGALLVLVTPSGNGDSSVISSAAGWVMTLPTGRILVALSGAVTVIAGLYYLRKAWTGAYREKLMANPVTENWNLVLKAGVLSQAIIVTLIGAFLIFAGLVGDPSEAGGTEAAFDWVSKQPFGRVLVTLVCLGLLAFALFCAVNARYRIVPKLADEGIVSLAQRLSEKLSN